MLTSSVLVRITRLPLSPFQRAATAVLTWPEQAQVTARRNALIAATELSQRRAERQAIDAYVAKATARFERRHPRVATA